MIIATGGRSYPDTGSNGYGYDLARSFGHGVIEQRPGNVPLLIAEEWPHRLQGVSVGTAGLSVTARGRRHDFTGGLLFTHYGISGPAALDASRVLADGGAALSLPRSI